MTHPLVFLLFHVPPRFRPSTPLLQINVASQKERGFSPTQVGVSVAQEQHRDEEHDQDQHLLHGASAKLGLQLSSVASPATAASYSFCHSGYSGQRDSCQRWTRRRSASPGHAFHAELVASMALLPPPPFLLVRQMPSSRGPVVRYR